VSNAVSSDRSIVHHQAANRVRSRRETIETPREDAGPVVPGVG
jgi:hypothetical protein